MPWDRQFSRMHQLYRTMAVGEELDPAAEGVRAVKDEIEERLFARRRDLFRPVAGLHGYDQLSFHGAGGESLGAQSLISPRPATDGAGGGSRRRGPPGVPAPPTTVLLPVVDRLLRDVVRTGGFSAATMLEERGLYILGARERGTAVVREVVLQDKKPFVPLLSSAAVATPSFVSR